LVLATGSAFGVNTRILCKTLPVIAAIQASPLPLPQNHNQPRLFLLAFMAGHVIGNHRFYV